MLRRKLVAARDGHLSLSTAIGDYEAQMRDYGFDAVLASRKQMSGDDPIHIGRAVLAGMRTGMRVVNRLPPLKRRMADDQQRYRGADRHDDPSTQTTAAATSR